MSEKFDRIKLFDSTKLERITMTMSTCIMQSNFIDDFVGNDYFWQWFLLSIDVPEHMKWLYALIETDEQKFDNICRGVLPTLYRLMEDISMYDGVKCINVLF